MHPILQVGTNGYTAPEILKGEHYGTPADVFSFSIVMFELLTLRAPYSDITKGGGDAKDNKKLMSWDQVVALTHDEDVMLRPTLPVDIDAEVAELVRNCWAHDPATRPSCTVIVARLDKIGRATHTEISHRLCVIVAPLEKASLRMPDYVHEIFLRAPLKRFFLHALEGVVHLVMNVEQICQGFVQISIVIDVSHLPHSTYS